MKNNTFLRIAIMAIVVLSTTATFAQTGYSRSKTGPRGNTSSTQGTVTGTKGGWNRNQTTTGSNGKAYNTNTTITGFGTGTINRIVLRTGPKGNTSTTNGTMIRTDTGINTTSTKTGFRGKSTTSTGSFQRTKKN